MPYELSIRWDPSFGQPNTYILNDAGDGIRARLRVLQGPEVVVDLHLRCNKSRAQAPDAFHVRRLNEDTWQVESAKFHTDLPRLELVLRGMPPHVAAALSVL